MRSTGSRARPPTFTCSRGRLQVKKIGGLAVSTTGAISRNCDCKRREAGPGISNNGRGATSAERGTPSGVALIVG